MANYQLNYTGLEIDALLASIPDKQSKITADGLLVGDGTGTITVATASDIPDLDTSKITSGTFSTARIPSLSASKITSGQFADERISSANTWNGKSAKATVYTGTLLANGWSNNEQTLTISGLSISGYAYTVSPTSGDFEDYASSMIWANDVTVANNITFNCKEAPSADIDIIILGCEVA